MRELSPEQQEFVAALPEARMGTQYVMATFKDGTVEMIRVFYGTVTDTMNPSEIVRLEEVLVDKGSW